MPKVKGSKRGRTRVYTGLRIGRKPHKAGSKRWKNRRGMMTRRYAKGRRPRYARLPFHCVCRELHEIVIDRNSPEYYQQYVLLKCPKADDYREMRRIHVEVNRARTQERLIHA